MIERSEENDDTHYTILAMEVTIVGNLLLKVMQFELVNLYFAICEKSNKIQANGFITNVAFKTSASRSCKKKLHFGTKTALAETEYDLWPMFG